MTWDEFLAALRDIGGSTDMQTSKTGRYPFLFHFQRGQVLEDVVVYAHKNGKVLTSPARDWSTREKLVADYQAMDAAGGRFNDTKDALSTQDIVP